MQPQPDNAWRSGQETTRPLPMNLAERLAPRSRRALMHGTRRRILRVLTETRPPGPPRSYCRHSPASA